MEFSRGKYSQNPLEGTMNGVSVVNESCYLSQKQAYYCTED